MLGSGTSIVPGSSLKIQVQHVRMHCTLCTPRFDCNQLSTQGVRQPCDDFVLHLKETCDGRVEPFGPNMIPGRCVDQLHVHPKAAAAGLHRAFECVADIQLTPQCPYVDRLSLEGERGVTRNDE